MRSSLQSILLICLLALEAAAFAPSAHAQSLDTFIHIDGVVPEACGLDERSGAIAWAAEGWQKGEYSHTGQGDTCRTRKNRRSAR